MITQISLFSEIRSFFCISVCLSFYLFIPMIFLISILWNLSLIFSFYHSHPLHPPPPPPLPHSPSPLQISLPFQMLLRIAAPFWPLTSVVIPWSNYVQVWWSSASCANSSLMTSNWTSFPLTSEGTCVCVVVPTCTNDYLISTLATPCAVMA